MKFKMLSLFFASLFIFPLVSEARSSKNNTIGIMGMGNIDLIDTLPELDPGIGGGIYYDYRFNQRFSLTVDTWITTQDGEKRAAGDSGILMLGIPNVTLKVYLLNDESAKFDPFVGLGIGVYALTEGSIVNGTNGVGLGGQIELGFDYYFTDAISAGFSGTFRSASIIQGVGSNSAATAKLIYSLIGRVGYHF